MKEHLPLHFHTNAETGDIIDPSLGDNHFLEKNNKKWSIQRGYMQFRRAPILIQRLMGLLAIYILSWSFSSLPIFPSHENNSSINSVKIAIAVLGGGLLSDGSLPKHTQLRVNEAVQLYRSLNGQARIITLSGGTPYKPNPTDDKGFPVLEATAAAKSLLEKGVPSDHVYEEAFSLDTIGNAYWLRSIHMHPGKYRELYVITNDWHMPRTEAIFKTVFSLPDADPHSGMTPFSVSSASQMNFYLPHIWMQLVSTWLISRLTNIDSSVPIKLHFVPASAGIDDANILKIRREKEQKSLEGFVSKVAPQWRTWYDLHIWLFSQHNAYASKRLLPSSDSQAKKPLSAEEELLLKTY